MINAYTLRKEKETAVIYTLDKAGQGHLKLDLRLK